MRISLWQQFSSNHSAMYTVVGKFDSVEAAAAAGAKIRQNVVDIVAWYEQNKADRPPLSPAEASLAAEYHFDWMETVDWLRRFPRWFRPAYLREPGEYVLHFDRIVFVEAPGASSTWQTGHQFANLMVAMGAQVYSSVSMGEDPKDQHFTDKQIELEMRCIAPTIEAAANLEHQLHDLQEWDVIPWMVFHPRYAALANGLSSDLLHEAEPTWIREHQAWQAFVRANSSVDLDWQSKRKQYITQDDLIDDAIDHLRRETWLRNLNCTRHDQLVAFRVSSSDYAGIETFLPAFVSWLHAQEFTVDYQFYQTELS